MRSSRIIWMLFCFPTFLLAHGTKFSYPVRDFENHSPPILTEHLSIPENLENQDSSLIRRTPTSQLNNYTVGMKVLVLSAGQQEDPGLDLVLEMLTSLHIPFDHVQLTREGVIDSHFSLGLEISPEIGRYQGIITTVGDLPVMDSEGKWVPALPLREQEKLDHYRQKFGVRMVEVVAFPSLSRGVRLAESPSSSDVIVSLSSSVDRKSSALTLHKALLKYSWIYPIEVVDKDAVTPILVNHNTQSPLATIYKKDNLETLSFFYSQSPLFEVSLAMSNFWIPWLTRGIFQGKRRINISLQVDDIFPSSFLWDPKTSSNPEKGDRRYRSTKEDIEHNVKWMRMLKNKFDLDLKLEIAFNGEGYFEFGGEKDEAHQTWIREKDKFYWVSHTFTHDNLDRVSYDKAEFEILENIKVANQILGGVSANNYSTRSMVSPEISGLFNPDVLRALYDNGFRYVIGDNSRPRLKPRTSVVGRYTTREMNGFPGLYIIPRHVNEIFWDVSTPEELASEYNLMYRDHWGRDLSALEIINLASDRILANTLRFDQASYMFHAPNMHKFPWESRSVSLIELWLEKYLAKFRQYLSLPFTNLKMEDLAEQYMASEKLSKCSFEGFLAYSNHKPRFILGNSEGTCTVPVTLPFRPRQFPGKHEVYGPDHTIYLELTPNKPIQVKLGD